LIIVTNTFFFNNPLSKCLFQVYDITDADSFTKVKNWVKELRKMLGSEICLVIAGNKIDLEKERHVSAEAAEE
jgi:Ras-related protein Rab-21